MATTATDLPRKRKLTVTDYYRLAEAGSLSEDDRVELIDGEIIDMAPIGSPHASKVLYLDRLLQKAVGDHALVSAQMPVRLGIHSEPQPDLMLVEPKADFYASGHPSPEDVFLVIEVAQTSLRYDRDTKVPLYARHGIPEVWLVDVDHQRLVIYRQPCEGSYREVIDPAPLTETTLSALAGVSVDLAALF